MKKRTLAILAAILAGGIVSGCSLWKDAPASASGAENAGAEKPGAPNSSAENLSADKEETTCPKVEIVRELRRLYRFPSGATPAPGGDLYSATLSTVNSDCTVDQAGIKVRIGLTLTARRGAAMVLPYGEHGSSIDVTYFVAVTDPSGHVIDKALFPTRLDFAEGIRPTVTEELEQRIPAAKLLSAASLLSAGKNLGSPGQYAIEIGLQLSPEELQFVREKQEAE